MYLALPQKMQTVQRFLAKNNRNLWLSPILANFLRVSYVILVFLPKSADSTAFLAKKQPKPVTVANFSQFFEGVLSNFGIFAEKRRRYCVFGQKTTETCDCRQF